MAAYSDEADPDDWKDEAHRLFRNVVGVIDEYQGHIVPGSTAAAILADIRFGATALAEQIVRGDRDAALRSITGLRESIYELLRGTG